MGNEHFSRVIKEWCSATGMRGWTEHEDMHVEFGDTLVGLIHGGEDAPDDLQIYIDLGQIELPDLHRALLEQNILPEFPSSGCFGLHPLTNSIVYRTRLTLTAETNGASLPLEIHQIIDSARERLTDALLN